jgi:hypothetical protein
MMRRCAAGCALLLALFTGALTAISADSWELQYQHLDKEYDLRLIDVAFIDARRGLAIGFIDSREQERQRPVNLVTVDGKTWSLFEVKRMCTDVFALPSGILFAACEDGIYRSDEMGKDWKRTARLRNIVGLWFLNERQGFAVGTGKGLYATQDGGNRWAPVTPNPEIRTNKDYTVLRHIAFAGQKAGFITGWNRPPRGREPLPDWLDPDRAMRQRDTPHVNIFLDTADGGATWNTQEVSMFGEVVSTKPGADGIGLTLVNFSNGFEFPSEVFAFTWPKGQMQRAYREKHRAITDVAVPPKGYVYLAAVEPTGQLYWSPIPGKLRVIRSVDFVKWEEMEVDYRASARRARLEAFDENNIWIVTDTGMILKLKREEDLPARVPPQRSQERPAQSTAAPQ